MLSLGVVAAIRTMEQEFTTDELIHATRCSPAFLIDVTRKVKRKGSERDPLIDPIGRGSGPKGRTTYTLLDTLKIGALWELNALGCRTRTVALPEVRRIQLGQKELVLHVGAASMWVDLAKIQKRLETFK